MRFLRRRQRTIYGCGNCRETFRDQAALDAHHPCPMVLLEREIADWNAHVRRALKALGREPS